MTGKTLLRSTVFFTGLVVVIWLTVSVVWAPGLARTVGVNPVTDTPAQVGLEYEDILVDSDGLALRGWWIPAPSPRAVILFAHGAGSNRTSWFLPSLEFYKAAHDLGLSVATIDLRNHGNSPRTDGKLGMGSSEWPDMLALSAWLDARGLSDLPRLGVGLSMGGATLIYALSEGLQLEAAILIDPLLNTYDALKQGGWIAYGLPPGLFAPMAWAATREGGLPKGDRDAGVKAQSLTLPILLMQDPDDPITRLPFALELAASNPYVQLEIAPPVPSDGPCLANKGRWGTHVALFKCHKSWTMDAFADFLTRSLAPTGTTL